MGLTTDFRVQLAVDLFNATGVWGVIGRTTAWPDENNPPAEDVATTLLDTPIGYKKILTKLLVKPDVSGDIQFKNQNYAVVTVEEAFNEDVVRVFLEFSFDYDEVPLSTFRQIGIHRGLVPTAGNELALVLQPAQVASAGPLLYYVNRLAETRAIDKKNIIRRILQF